VADLSAEKREDIPSKHFGLPEKARTTSAKKESGNYPMSDKKHARNAKARAAQQLKAGTSPGKTRSASTARPTRSWTSERKATLRTFGHVAQVPTCAT